MAATNRIRNYCKGLINNNIDAEVLICRSTECACKDNINPSKGNWKGVKYCYPKTSIRSKSFIKRRIDDARDLFKTLRYIYKSDSEIVYIYMNSLIIELFVLIATKIANKKLVRELCEYPYYKKCLKSWLNFLYFRFYDGIVAISHELERIASIKCRHNTKIIKIPILVDPDGQGQDKYKNIRPYIFHGGTLTESKDAIISTMKAFAIANNQLNNTVDFILAGPPSSDLLELQRIVEDNHLEENVKLIGQIPAEEISKYQNGASLSIINKNDTLQNRCGFSTKLGETLLSGTAVITTTIGEANYWLKDGQNAYITYPHSPELIADKIVYAFKDKDLRDKIAINGKLVAINSFSVMKQGAILANFFMNFEK